jgi:hypothetical protein
MPVKLPGSISFFCNGSFTPYPRPAVQRQSRFHAERKRRRTRLLLPLFALLPGGNYFSPGFFLELRNNQTSAEITTVNAKAAAIIKAQKLKSRDILISFHKVCMDIPCDIPH